MSKADGFFIVLGIVMAIFLSVTSGVLLEQGNMIGFASCLVISVANILAVGREFVS